MGNIDDALEDQAERYTEHTMKLAKQLDAIEDIVRPRDRETIVEAVRRVLGKRDEALEALQWTLDYIERHCEWGDPEDVARHKRAKAILEKHKETTP
ncbi:MAG TPA: hypothetical protein DDX54_03965 [Rhodospirillaceae bacterium]|jgi:hypothetical protein|nr:hypothetical protein [Alphaproteobacteria bacterium]HBH26540.1 hypothetical protein [Rhodospirillaceae bacterium]